MSIIIGIDHGYYAIKTARCSFPAGLASYGEHEPYTRQAVSYTHLDVYKRQPDDYAREDG